MYKLQSVLLNKKLFDLHDAIEFIIKNNLLLKKVDETEHYYRFRQINPITLKNQGFTKVVTKDVADGIKFIIYFNE